MLYELITKSNVTNRCSKGRLWVGNDTFMSPNYFKSYNINPKSVYGYALDNHTVVGLYSNGSVRISRSNDSNGCTSMDDGEDNSIKMIGAVACSDISLYPAVYHCYNQEFRTGRHGYLPAINELKYLCDNLDDILSVLNKLKLIGIVARFMSQSKSISTLNPDGSFSLNYDFEIPILWSSTEVCSEDNRYQNYVMDLRTSKIHHFDKTQFFTVVPFFKF